MALNPTLVAALVPTLIGLAALGIGVGITFLLMRQKSRIAVGDCESAMNRQIAELSQSLAAAQEKGSRIPEMELSAAAATREVQILREQQTRATARLATMETQLANERKGTAEKLAVLDEAQKRFSDAFKALSSEALRQNNTSFLELAKGAMEKTQLSASSELEKRQTAINELIKPMLQSLEKVDGKIHEMEKARTGAYESLTTQVKSLAETQNLLRSETGNLVRALRSPSVRGRWGEIQLRRVVELAGMVAHCDFVEQPTIQTEEGRLRPDLIVHPPGGKTIVVDAKTPLTAYLDALEATTDEVRLRLLDQHAAQVRSHVDKLARRAYAEQFEESPDFIVLFLAGEVFYSAALERDPSLIEYAADKKIIIATPTTLIGLLMAICYGWRQEKLAQNAREISQLGSELYDRFANLADHFGKVGRALNASVKAYNDAVGTMESRVLVSARKFKELQAAPMGKEIEVLSQVEQIARDVQAPELLPLQDHNGRTNGA